jgi:DnaK suppressor protein
MDVETLVQQLREEERQAADRVDRAVARATEPRDEDVPDLGDLGQQTLEKDTSLREADAARRHLDEVRAALARVEAGTYGLCVVDGEPIEPQRLQAVPWAERCLVHQEELESRAPAP